MNAALWKGAASLGAGEGRALPLETTGAQEDFSPLALQAVEKVDSLCGRGSKLPRQVPRLKFSI